MPPSCPPSPALLGGLLGGLLVGGASRRMGTPKALLTVDGLTFAERAVAALAPHVERVVLLGGGPVPAALEGLERLPDAAIPGVEPGTGAGPLAALLAALRAAPAAAWILCPCDLPAVRPAAVGWLAAERRPERRAVMARRSASSPPEPLLALYEPTILAAVEQLVAAGGRAPRRLATLPGVAVLTPPDDLADCWRDADHPDELPTAQRPEA